MPRQRMNKSIKMKIKAAVMLMAAVTGIVLISVLMVVNAKKETLEYDGYQYFNERRFDYPSGTKLELEANEIKLKSGEASASADTTPIYYEDREEMITTRNMSYVNPKTGEERYIPIFTTLYKNEDDQICIRKNKKEHILDGGFLFDGQSTYVFLDKVTLNYAGRRYEANPFSFAVVTLDGDTRTYLYGTAEYYVDSILSDSVYADEEVYGYQIQLKYDTMRMITGDDKLLFVEPGLLDPIE